MVRLLSLVPGLSQGLMQLAFTSPCALGTPMPAFRRRGTRLQEVTTVIRLRSHGGKDLDINAGVPVSSVHSIAPHHIASGLVLFICGPAIKAAAAQPRAGSNTKSVLFS